MPTARRRMATPAAKTLTTRTEWPVSVIYQIRLSKGIPFSKQEPGGTALPRIAVHLVNFLLDAASEVGSQEGFSNLEGHVALVVDGDRSWANEGNVSGLLHQIKPQFTRKAAKVLAGMGDRLATEESFDFPLDGKPLHGRMVAHKSLDRVKLLIHNYVENSISNAEMVKDDNASPPSPNTDEAGLIGALRAAAALLPDGYDAKAPGLARLNHAFREELAAQLTRPLNEHVQAMPRGTYEEKKLLAKFVNEQLRRFDLALKCPKTEQPSILLVGPGNHPEIGRFILEHKDLDGKRIRTVQTPELPYLALMEANPRREALIEWRDRIRQNQPPPSRA